MALAILPIVGGLILLYVLSYFATLYKHYREGRATGLPLVVCPINPDNIIYMIISVPIRPLLERVLPEWIYFGIRPSIYGWEFRDRYQITHPKVGDSFLLVSSGSPVLWIADPALGTAILQRRKDFVQQKITGVVMDVMGPNVLSVSFDPFTSPAVANILPSRTAKLGLVNAESLRLI